MKILKSGAKNENAHFRATVQNIAKESLELYEMNSSVEGKTSKMIGQIAQETQAGGAVNTVTGGESKESIKPSQSTGGNFIQIFFLVLAVSAAIFYTSQHIIMELIDQVMDHLGFDVGEMDGNSDKVEAVVK